MRKTAKQKTAGKKPRKKNRFSSIEIEKPDRSGDVTRDGKKSVNWKDDPEILTRLADVADLMNRNQPSYVIAQECSTSIATAKRDMLRVRELWKEFAKERLEDTVNQALVQYGTVIDKAWTEFESAPKALKAQFLTAVLRAQERIDKVTGIADPVALGNMNNKPFQVENIEDVRSKRWQQVSGKIQKVVNNG